jgi:hypothetical protein
MAAPPPPAAAKPLAVGPAVPPEAVAAAVPPEAVAAAVPPEAVGVVSVAVGPPFAAGLTASTAPGLLLQPSVMSTASTTTASSPRLGAGRFSPCCFSTYRFSVNCRCRN